MSMSDRILQRRKVQKLSHVKLAEAIGVSRVAIGQWESGISEPDGKNLLKCAFVLKADPYWLAFGDQPVIDPKLMQAYAEESAKLGLQVVDHIPLLTWREVSIYQAEDKETRYRDRPIVPVYAKEASHCLALQVKKQDMVSTLPHAPSFPKDTLLIVNPKSTAKDGDFVIASLPGHEEPIFKQYVTEAGKHYLNSLNTQYPTWEMTPAMKILGVVIEHRYKLKD